MRTGRGGRFESKACLAQPRTTTPRSRGTLETPSRRSRTPWKKRLLKFRYFARRIRSLPYALPSPWTSWTSRESPPRAPGALASRPSVRPTVCSAWGKTGGGCAPRGSPPARARLARARVERWARRTWASRARARATRRAWRSTTRTGETPPSFAFQRNFKKGFLRGRRISRRRNRGRRASEANAVTWTRVRNGSAASVADVRRWRRSRREARARSAFTTTKRRVEFELAASENTNRFRTSEESGDSPW